MQLVIGSQSGKTFQKIVDPVQVRSLFGKSIGDSFKGELINLPGYEFKITGASDSAGFPLSKAITGTERKKRLLLKGLGMNDPKPGLKLRKSVRGRVLSEAVAQINVKVAKNGKEPLEKLLG